MMSYGVSLCKMRCRWHWCICWRRYRALCYGTIRVMQFYDPSLTSSLLSSLLWAIYFFDRHHCHGCSKFKITKVCFTAELFQLLSARYAFVPLFPQVISIFSVYNRIPMIYSTAWNALVLQCIAYCQFVSGTPIKLGSSPCISIRCVCPASGASCSIRCRTVIIGAAAICSWSLNILFHTRLWINKVASLTTAFLFVKSLTLTLVDNDLHLS